jgi:5-methylcytosine-specific restriction endonuclease McrA
MLAFLYSLVPLWLRPARILAMRENSYRWKKLRREHLQREPVCQACGRAGELEVHHIIPVSFDKHRQFDPNNLITLCASPCHLTFGHLMCYHCYNKDVRKMTAEYRKAIEKRRCLQKFR